MDTNVDVNLSLLATNFVGFIALLFLCILVKSNRTFDKVRKRNFILASITVMSLIAIEVLDYNLYSYTFYENATESFIKGVAITRYVIAFIEFSFCPLVPIFLTQVVVGGKRNFTWLSLIISVGLCIGNIFYPYLFDINEKALYIHGKLFLIPTILCFILMVVLIAVSLAKYQTLKRIEKTSICLMLLAIFVAAGLQYWVFPGSYLIWNSVAIFLVIYYLIVQIQMFLLDPLTGLYNRSIWENDLKELEGRTDATLVMLDLNNLKKINDVRGHNEGDKAINRVAHIVRLTFGKIGKCYRIGGDEFAAICKCNDEKVQMAFKLLDKYIASQEYTVASGSVRYDHTSDEDIRAVFKKADKIMYANKEEMKKNLSLKD